MKLKDEQLIYRFPIKQIKLNEIPQVLFPQPIRQFNFIIKDLQILKQKLRNKRNLSENNNNNYPKYKIRRKTESSHTSDSQNFQDSIKKNRIQTESINEQEEESLENIKIPNYSLKRLSINANNGLNDLKTQVIKNLLQKRILERTEQRSQFQNFYQNKTKEFIEQGKMILINIHENETDNILKTPTINNPKEYSTIESIDQNLKQLSNSLQFEKTLDFLEQEKNAMKNQQNVKQQSLERLFIAYNNALAKCKNPDELVFIQKQIDKYQKFVRFKPIQVIDKVKQKQNLIAENRKNLSTEQNVDTKDQDTLKSKILIQSIQSSNQANSIKSSGKCEPSLNQNSIQQQNNYTEEHQKILNKLNFKANYLIRTYENSEEDSKITLSSIKKEQKRLIILNNKLSKETQELLKEDFNNILYQSNVKNQLKNQ